MKATRINRVFTITLVVVLTLAFAFSLKVPSVKADSLSTYKTVIASAYDGKIYYTSTVSWSDANSQVSGTVDDDIPSIDIGQHQVFDQLTISRGYLPFDTAVLPDSAVIDNVTLSIYIASDMSTADFNVTVQDGQPTYPHVPLQSGDYYRAWYSGSYGSRNTSEIVGTGFWNITFNDEGLDLINIGGTTKLCIRGTNDINVTSDVGDIYIYSREYLEAYAPKLYIGYHVDEAVRVTIHGPYLESGAVYDGVVYATVTFYGNETTQYLFNGTDGADTETLLTDAIPVSVYWNCTADYSKIRSYYFTEGATNAEVWLHVANTTTESLNLYYISVTDFAGLTNAYVSIQKAVGTELRTIERQPLDVLNSMPFYLITFSTYKLKLSSSEGSWTWNLQADAVTTKSFLVTQDMVASATPMNFTVSATRTNATTITVVYYDPNGTTVSVQLDFYYRAGGSYIEVYTETDEGSNINVEWTYAESTRNYYVNVTATYASETKNWWLSVPKLKLDAFDFTFFNVFGDLPFPVDNILGIFIIGLVFGIFSWKDAEIGAGLSVIVAAFLWYIGLLDIPIMAIAAAFMIVLFMFLHKGKETSREPM